jgi:hypothetical protein
MTDRVKAVEMLEEITDFDNNGVSHEAVLIYLIKNFLPGDQALECIEAAKKELYFLDEDEEDE